MLENRNYFSVSDLNVRIRKTLEGELKGIRVQGELSNFHHHLSSGHMYFTLKDDNGEIRCVMFRGNNLNLKFTPSDGVEVKLYGDVTFFEQRGTIQIKVSFMEPEGIGDLYKAFEELKNSLGKEGLFDQKYKKILPSFPKKAGVITSGSGAALKDILNVLSRRAPQVKIFLKSVKVQGIGAADNIAKSIQLFNDLKNVDVLIIARGGGSMEDLWAFNEEIVVRAIFKSRIPVITGIGHETDFSIADFVSDVRAPTPSAAAELVSPSIGSIIKELESLKSQIIKIILVLIEKSWFNIDRFERSLSVLQPQKKIQYNIQTLNSFKQRINYMMEQKVNQYQFLLNSLSKRLINLGPNNVLERGYAIPTDNNGNIVKTAHQIKIGETFNLQTRKGSLSAKKISDIINN